MADQYINELTDYTPPLDADSVPIYDNANSLTKRTTWSNFKATLKTYFDTLYPAITQIVITAAKVLTVSKTMTLTAADDTGVYTMPTGTKNIAATDSDITGKSAKTDALNSATTVVNVSSATAPSSGQVLTATGSTAATWQTPATGFNSKLRISTAFEKVERFTIDASGGTNTFDTRGLSLNTTSTTTRYVSATMVAVSNNFKAFSGSPTFSCSFALSPLNTTGSLYLGIGAVTVAGTGHTYTTNHIGFKVLIVAGVASLYATQGNGTTENASSALTTVADSDLIDVICVVNGTSSVDYYWRKNGGALSSATNLTSNLPTAATEVFAQFSISNNSTANTQAIYLTGANYER